MLRSVRRLATAIVLMAALPATAQADKAIVSAQARADGGHGGRRAAPAQARPDLRPCARQRHLGEGLCAHGTIRWHHVNGTAYDDYGMVNCGFGTAQEFDVPDRAWARI
jgi:hypothetical protein